MHKDPATLVRTLRSLRRRGILHIHTSVTWNINFAEVYISTEAGRLVRPVYIVENNKLRITAKQMEDVGSGKLHWDNLFGVTPTGIDVDRKGKRPPKLVSNGPDEAVMEWLDVSESETSMIALSPADLDNNSPDNQFYLKYTHCEIHPSTMFGVVISDMPFPDHNQVMNFVIYISV